MIIVHDPASKTLAELLTRDADTGHDLVVAVPSVLSHDEGTSLGRSRQQGFLTNQSVVGIGLDALVWLYLTRVEVGVGVLINSPYESLESQELESVYSAIARCKRLVALDDQTRIDLASVHSRFVEGATNPVLGRSEPLLHDETWIVAGDKVPDSDFMRLVRYLQSHTPERKIHRINTWEERKFTRIASCIIEFDCDKASSVWNPRICELLGVTYVRLKTGKSLIDDVSTGEATPEWHVVGLEDLDDLELLFREPSPRLAVSTTDGILYHSADVRQLRSVLDGLNL